MSQNSKTAKIVLGWYYRVLNSRLALTRLAILNTWNKNAKTETIFAVFEFWLVSPLHSFVNCWSFLLWFLLFFSQILSSCSQFCLKIHCHGNRGQQTRNLSYSQFCPQVRCHGNGGWQGKNFNDTARKPGSENKGWVQTVHNYLSRGQSYSQFCPKIHCHGNGDRQGRKISDTIG